MSKKGFSLLEIMVAITVFALVVASAGGVFISVQRAWQRQKAILDLIQNARQAMEAMTNEIRNGGSGSVYVYGDRVQFVLNGSWVSYWRAGSTIFRGLGWFPSSGSELANFVVNNPSTNAIFRPHPSLPNLYIIELTVAQNNRSYTLRTQARPRN